MVSFELLEAERYYTSLLQDIPTAKKRIVIAAMTILWGGRTGPIFVMLQDALKRGVQVTVLLDNYTRLVRFMPLKTPPSGKERLQQTFRTLENLSAQGAKVFNFGKIGLIPQKGRCHVKITLIDDTSYSFGGVNFVDEMFGNTDYMLKSKGAELADHLEQLVKRISRTRPPLLDEEVRLNKDNSVLFDGGRPKRSLIYERACELASQAKKIYFVSAMAPSGELARLLAENGASIYSNRPEDLLPLEGMAQAFDLQKHRTENRYKGDTHIHSKTMLFEMPSGRKVVLSGSHNFNYRGVSYGTQEICLHSTDTALWEQLYKYIQRRAVKTP